MIRKYVLSLLAVAGFVLALYTVRAGSQPIPAAPPVVEPSKVPFARYVAGAGIVESASRNIEIGTPVPGLVVETMVEAGATVMAGDALFRLDDRALKAELAVREAAVASAKAQLEKLKSMPRPEDIPPAEARVRAAEQALANVREEFALWESVDDPRAVSQDVLDRKRFAVRVAEAELAEASAQFDLLKAGAWAPDLQVAQAAVDAAEAQAQQTRTELDRLIIRSPIDGRVLQANVRPGEFAQAGAPSGADDALMLLGEVQHLHVRVDVDENDAWRVASSAKAVAYLRGNAALSTDLTFVHFEPYVIPKRSLTGGSTERVDTRVLQVIYRIERSDLPVYVGQLMDVFVEAPALKDGGGA